MERCLFEQMKGNYAGCICSRIFTLSRDEAAMKQYQRQSRNGKSCGKDQPPDDKAEKIERFIEKSETHGQSELGRGGQMLDGMTGSGYNST